MSTDRDTPPHARDRTTIFGAREGNEGIVRCDACPVLCRIRPGRAGACSRYANRDGELVRTDPLVLMTRTLESGGETVPFLENAEDWDGSIVPQARGTTMPPQARGTTMPPQAGGATMPSEADGTTSPPQRIFVSAIGAGTTYPDYKPAPFIVASKHRGVDTVTVVTEGIFSYCGLKVKIDTDRHLGPETAAVRVDGEQIGHVTTAEYGSQMLSLGGVRHLTGGSKKEGNVTCAAMLALCEKQPVEVAIDGGARVVLQAGKAPVVNGVPEQRMRVGCGSAAIGIFAQQWHGHVDEVIVVDDHITGVLSEHQAGKCLDVPPTGIRVRGRRSTPGRYFQVAHPGTGWGGTDITDPLSIIESIDPKIAWPGLRLLLTSTTGEDHLYVELDETLRPVPAPTPATVLKTVERIGENCEPALTSILFMAGAGGSLRAGVTENPVLLTREVQRSLVRVTIGGAPAFLWPGGGITIMADVLRVPEGAFGHVPTPALVAPIEFTLRADLYARLGGHVDHAVPLERLLAEYGDTARQEPWLVQNPWPAPS